MTLVTAAVCASTELNIDWYVLSTENQTETQRCGVSVDLEELGMLKAVSKFKEPRRRKPNAFHLTIG